MVTAPAAPTIVLIAVVRDHSLGRVLDTNGYAVVQPASGTLALEWAREIRPDLIILDAELPLAVVQPASGTLALEWAREIRPDLIILDAELPDMSGIDACCLFCNDPGIGRNVPVLIVTADKPTPEQRVTALC